MPDPSPDETVQQTLTGDVTTSTRVGHCRKDDVDEYAGRGPDGRDMTETPIGEKGWLGNPYTVEAFGRETCVAKFREDFESRLRDDDEFHEAVRALQGTVLGCWCQRLGDDGPACHAQVIAEWADQLARDD